MAPQFQEERRAVHDRLRAEEAREEADEKALEEMESW